MEHLQPEDSDAENAAQILGCLAEEQVVVGFQHVAEVAHEPVRAFRHRQAP